PPGLLACPPLGGFVKPPALRMVADFRAGQVSASRRDQGLMHMEGTDERATNVSEIEPALVQENCLAAIRLNRRFDLIFRAAGNALVDSGD
ncbi:MAG TPA: hypothetical protein VE398_09210, partial [Acidobacteriota bacterium]|nr:hypothetical protein [Acidobacteriota bacterium]